MNLGTVDYEVSHSGSWRPPYTGLLTPPASGNVGERHAFHATPDMPSRPKTSRDLTQGKTNTCYAIWGGGGDPMEILSLRPDPSTAKFEVSAGGQLKAAGSSRWFISSWLVRRARVGRTSAAVIKRCRTPPGTRGGFLAAVSSGGPRPARASMQHNRSASHPAERRWKANTVEEMPLNRA